MFICGEFLLRSFHIDITNHCNLACEYCYFYSADNTKLAEEPSTEDLISWVRQAQEVGVKLIVISGGESLLRKDLFEVIDHVHVQKVLLTNATLLDKNKILKFNQIPNLQLKVSFDGYAGHDSIRGHGTSKLVQHAIKLLNNYSKIPYTINTVITENNEQELLDIYDFVSRTKSYRWEVDFPLYLGKGKSFNKAVKDKHKTYKHFIAPLISKYFEDGCLFKLNMLGVIRWEIFEDNHSAGFQDYNLSAHPCEYAMPSATAHTNGDVSFCPSLPVVFGNLNKNSLEEILKFEKYQQFMRLKITDIPKCSKCKYVKLCGGGCMADAFGITGKMLEVDESSCERAALFEQYILPVLPLRIQQSYLKLMQE